MNLNKIQVYLRMYDDENGYLPAYLKIDDYYLNLMDLNKVVCTLKLYLKKQDNIGSQF